MGSIDIDQLANEIANSLTEYEQTIIRGTEKAGKKLANKAVKQLRADSPQKSGRYGKGWKTETTNGFGQETQHTIYNKSRYFITHLLEHGYMARNGKRIKKQEHIRPAEEMVIKEYTDSVKEVIKNAGS